jgi:hypothetical protein
VRNPGGIWPLGSTSHANAKLELSAEKIKKLTGRERKEWEGRGNDFLNKGLTAIRSEEVRNRRCSGHTSRRGIIEKTPPHIRLVLVFILRLQPGQIPFAGSFHRLPPSHLESHPTSAASYDPCVELTGIQTSRMLPQGRESPNLTSKTRTIPEFGTNFDQVISSLLTQSLRKAFGRSPATGEAVAEAR